MSRNARNWMYLLFAILLFCITLGYAYLNTELEINGTTNITSANWSVYWDNIQYGSNNVTDITTPATIKSNLTEVVFNVNFSEPGDTYEFTVDAVNDGSIDAMISVVTSGVYAANGTTPKTLPDYLEYSVTYSDGVPIAQNHILEAGDTETYKVRVHYKEDITASQLPSTNDNYMFKIGVAYIQKTSSGIPRPNYVYSVSSTGFNIGSAIPNGEIPYNNYNTAITAFGHDFFIRHRIENDLVSESYVGFILNNNVYYLRGAGATYNTQTSSYNNDSPYYESNKATLINAFGSSNCSEYVDGDYKSYSCSSSGLSASANSFGYVHAGDDDAGCYVSDAGSSYCGESF